jgi:hypothetical protein
MQLEELFRFCDEHDISLDAEVNNKDVNGDTALHLAMVGGSQPDTVKLLLGKGADILGSGLAGTTVLMKPLLPMEVIMDTYEDIYWNMDFLENPMDDACASECLRSVLDELLVRCGGRDSGNASPRIDTCGERNAD